jgi:hypothetical protein
VQGYAATVPLATIARFASLSFLGQVRDFLQSLAREHQSSSKASRDHASAEVSDHIRRWLAISLLKGQKCASKITAKNGACLHWLVSLPSSISMATVSAPIGV